MKQRVREFITTYIIFTLLFIIQKPVFMIFYHDLYKNISFSDFFSVIWHGLPLDLSLAGYLTAIPGLMLLCSIWTGTRRLVLAKNIYFAIISFIMAMVFIIDLQLYHFWGFKLDATAVFYFFSSPKDAMASVSLWFIIKNCIATLLYFLLIFTLFKIIIVNRNNTLKVPFKRVSSSAVMLIAVALLFIPIRGGFSVSTMNVSKVYFSQNQRLNHAAINPIFSLMYSLTHQNNFGEQYRFMKPEKANELFNQMIEQPINDSIPNLLNCSKPNIIFIVLESFSNHIMKTMGGIGGVTPNLDSLVHEGVVFTNFYANSFRTDRGLVSIFSGYPAQPTTSIMKYPKKTEKLPSIPNSLKGAGYNLHYYYGGDIDFTNMRSYVISSGINEITSDVDFPLSDRTGKWGVQDHVLFNKVYSDIENNPQTEPFAKFIQTSSSHEPFEVPYHKIEDKVLNAFAYTDKCVGDFIKKFRETKYWDNTLIVLVPDHLGCYPRPANNQDYKHHQVPLIFAGGAIATPTKIETYGSQIDIAATLLYQLGISHDTFKFSKNILNNNSPHFGYFTVPNAFGMITEDNQLVYDCDGKQVITDEGSNKGANLEKGKAFLQKLYDDIDEK